LALVAPSHSKEAAGFHQLSGTLQSFRNNTLIVETAPGIRTSIPIAGSLVITGPFGNGIPSSWLLPGDGVDAILDKNGRVSKIKTATTWYFGTVAFTTSKRLTLLEGPQFFVKDVPVFLNGEKIEKLSTLTPPNEVLVRFDSTHEKAVGVWAFDFQNIDDRPSDILDVRSSITTLPDQSKRLRVTVVARTSGKISVQLLGVTQRLSLAEKTKGHFIGSLTIPAKIAVPRTYLEIEWNAIDLGERIHEVWIAKKPIAFYTEKPQIAGMAPPAAKTLQATPPFIFIEFDTHQAPLDSKSARLVVDNDNVTPNCYIDSYRLFYSPDSLRPGKHVCVFSGRSVAGIGSIYQKWIFHVKP